MSSIIPLKTILSTSLIHSPQIEQNKQLKIILSVWSLYEGRGGRRFEETGGGDDPKILLAHMENLTLLTKEKVSQENDT